MVTPSFVVFLRTTQVRKSCRNWKARNSRKSLLEPTRIYVKAVLPLIKEELVNGIAHITGGGFIENVPRMFAADLAAEIEEDKVPVLPIFKALKNTVKSSTKKCLKSSIWVWDSCWQLALKM